MLQCYHHHGISYENRAEIFGRFEYFCSSKTHNILIFVVMSLELSDPSFITLMWHLLFFSFPEALEALKEINESVCPNDGFLDQVSFHYDLFAPSPFSFHLLSWIFYILQLKLFEEMGFKVDTSSPLYRRFRLKLLGWPFSFLYSYCTKYPRDTFKVSITIKEWR